jgi:hypothetical protein
LVLVSIVSPLNDSGSILGLSFANVQCLVAVASDVIGWLTLEFFISGRNEFPEFICLLVWLTAVDLNTVVFLSLRNFNSQVVAWTEKGESVVSNWSDGKLLVGSVVPFPQNTCVCGFSVLWAIQDQIVIEGSWEFIEEVFLWFEGHREDMFNLNYKI